MLTERENFRLLLSGEMPEFIPTYNMFAWRFYPSFNREGFKPDGSGFDIFGVEYTTAVEADGASTSTYTAKSSSRNHRLPLATGSAGAMAAMASSRHSSAA